ncbi:MAG: hypothetical protein JNL01_15520 [Bdellovibrionales bacterium]|nr:hypothetical protein [Bdellovibrionales bacterium]
MNKFYAGVFLANLVITQNAWSAEACSAQLRNVIHKREKADKISTIPAAPLVVLGIVGSNPFFFIAGLAVKLPFTISAKHARKIHDLIIEAHSYQKIPTKPEGRLMTKLLKKINKHKGAGQKVAFSDLAAAIVTADMDGTLCAGEKVPEQSDMLKVIEAQI